jgi:hypothetical protein
MAKPTRQLPGVKGQWILCSECPPTEADADTDGDICVDDLSSDVGYEWFKPENVRPHEYWVPAHACDPRPFTQPVVGARLFDTLSGNAEVVFAVADDKTGWVLDHPRGDWRQLPSLPDREAP